MHIQRSRTVADTCFAAWFTRVGGDQRLAPLVQQLALMHAVAGCPIGYESWMFDSPALRWHATDQLPPIPDQLTALEAEPGACYRNCLLAATLHEEYLYCEGWASTGLLGVSHAWLVHRDTGDLVDPTWTLLDDTDTDVFSYVGVAFDSAFAFRLQRDRSGTVVSGDWMTRGKLLTRPLRVGDHRQYVGWGRTPRG